jgi:putative restriction endonuclease
VKDRYRTGLGQKTSPVRLEVGREYSGRELHQLLGLPESAFGGAWFSGCQRHSRAFFLFSTIRPSVGMDSDRRDHWEGPALVWSAKGGGRIGDRQIQELVSGQWPVHILWRRGQDAPFTYAGEGTAMEARDTVPASILWSCPGAERRQG